jgi:protein-S-isoprenylcysteine O-methyltransferase Ste14
MTGETSGADGAPGALIGAGNWFFKYRNYAFPAFLAAIFLGLDPAPFMGSARADAWLDLAGVSVAALGSGFRFWVIGLAYIKRGGVNKQVFADRLVVNGMFGVCRNPLYVGNATVLLGLFLIHNNPWTYVLGAVFFGFAYAGIVAAEEQYLAAKFGGDYARYKAEVPRFWPDFRRYREATAGMAFDWRRALIKDYSSVYAWVVVAAAIGLVEHHGRTSGLFLPSPLWPNLAIISAATALVLLVRVLKKSGILAAD